MKRVQVMTYLADASHAAGVTGQDVEYGVEGLEVGCRDALDQGTVKHHS